MAWPGADALLFGGPILTLDRSFPHADWLVIRAGRIEALGRGTPPEWVQPRPGRPGPIRVDLQGAFAFPALIDAHAHILGQIDSLLGVDCSPRAVESIAEMQGAIAERAATLPPGAWIRANDYDEFYLAERRHPTRWDLDGAAGGRPVRLQHASRHIAVLNSTALALAGITAHTPDPPGGRIDRDRRTGQPTGVLREMNAWISRLVLPHLSPAELFAGYGAVSDRYLRHGVTQVHDATVRNGLAEWHIYQALIAGRPLGIRVQMMFGSEALPQLAAAGIGPRSGSPDLRLGALKILMAGHDGEGDVDQDRLPTQEALSRQVRAGHEAGHQVAIHAYDEWSVHLAVTAFEEALADLPRDDHRHRIEHASVCPDWLVGRIREHQLAVVTQPGFLRQNGDRYLAQIDPEWVPSFYRLGGLVAAGIRVAAGSDAPIGPVDPREILHGARQRRSREGRILAPEEAVTPAQALAALTATAAWVGFDERDLGQLQPGKLADIAVFDRDLIAASPEDLLQAECLLTIRGGRIAWDGRPAAALRRRSDGPAPPGSVLGT